MAEVLGRVTAAVETYWMDLRTANALYRGCESAIKLIELGLRRSAAADPTNRSD